MIARIWATKFDRGRLRELQAFANDISLPMLGRQPGNMGVMFAYDYDEWMTMTLWESPRSIAGLESAGDYRETVRRIEAAGFLCGDQKTTTYEICGAEVPEIQGDGAASKGGVR